MPMNPQARYAYDYYRKRGLPHSVAAGFVGNFWGESKLDPKVWGDNGTAGGIGQWRGNRLSNLKAFAQSQGKDWTDLDTQLAFPLAEADSKSPYRDPIFASKWNSVLGSASPQEATKHIMNYYERPNPDYAHLDRRVSAATSLGGNPMNAPYIRYANQQATRNQPLSPSLLKALSFIPEMGVTMEVFSGGQDGKGEGLRRLGSVRHDHGNAADAFFYKDGRKLDWANEADRPIFEQIVSRGKANGITGFGAGDGYMRPGSMHIGFGSPAVWGAGGKGSKAPDWLQAAYGMSAAPKDPPPSVQLNQDQLDFVKNNPQPGGFGPGIPDPNAPMAPPIAGAPMQGGQPDTGIPSFVADFATAQDGGGIGGRLGAFFSALGEAANVKAPRPPAHPGGPSPQQANAVLNFLSSPNAAESLLKKRLAFLG